MEKICEKCDLSERCPCGHHPNKNRYSIPFDDDGYPIVDALLCEGIRASPRRYHCSHFKQERS